MNNSLNKLGGNLRTLILGDVHGGLKALLDVFDKSSFDYGKDKLIVLGDVADGWSETKGCIDELMKVKNLIYILGNHDEWLWDWLKYKSAPNIWLSQGGRASIESFNNEGDLQKYADFFSKSVNYYVEDNKVFIHGGIPFGVDIKDASKEQLLWDRDLIQFAMNFADQDKITKYNEIFIGHTPTEIWSSYEPINKCEIWMLDTGAGWSGKLTIMDLETKEYWQSDFVQSYYPNEKGRR